MRNLEKNKQKLFYSLQDKEVPIYELDENGDVVYVEIDGKKVPVETGDKRMVYSKPKEFLGNITTSGGESVSVEFGIDKADYSAILVVDKEELPITETSLIWHETEPVMDEYGTVDEKSADYTVKKISPTLNTEKYLLDKVVK